MIDGAVSLLKSGQVCAVLPKMLVDMGLSIEEKPLRLHTPLDIADSGLGSEWPQVTV